MYFSLVSTWWTVPRVQGRPKSVAPPSLFSSAAIWLSTMRCKVKSL